MSSHKYEIQSVENQTKNVTKKGFKDEDSSKVQKFLSQDALDDIRMLAAVFLILLLTAIILIVKVYTRGLNGSDRQKS